MSAPRSSLRSFLANAKSNLQNAIVNQQRVTLVVGNESADLDSITSAILLAYLQSHSGHTPITNPSVNRHTPPSQYPPLYIPIVNIPRADIRIRPELLALLPHANIEAAHLITLDDLCADPPAGINPAGRETLQPNLTRLVLTDHNKITGTLAKRGFHDEVIGCIDHHVDEGSIPTKPSSEPRIIRTAGSCTSLVVEYCRSAWDSLSGSASNAGRSTAAQSDFDVGVDDAAVRRTWDAQIAKFAMASVLIDTTALQSQEKTEDVDRQAVDYLEAKIALAPGGVGAQWNRKNFFDEIDHAKKDLSSLTVDEVLIKDYKQWDVNGVQLGISSVVKPLSWQIEKAGNTPQFVQSLRKFAQNKKLDLISVMTTSTANDGQFQRELLLWSVNESKNEVVSRFEEQNRDELGLNQWQEKTDHDNSIRQGGKMKIWWQKETEYSRKQVSPLMRKAIQNS